MPKGPGPAILAGALLALVLALAYATTFSEPFVFDTAPIIARDASLRHLWPIWAPLQPPHDGSTVEGRPLLNLSLAVSYALSGTHVWAYHLLNLAIHLAAALALFGLVRRTVVRLAPGLAALDATAFALTVALFWSLHPLQTESVTYIIQRAESLMGLFYLLTLYGFVRSVDQEVTGRGARLWAVASCLACLGGMASKEVMATAPVLVLLYDRTFVGGSFRAAWAQRRGYYLALASTWILLALLLAGSATRSGTAGLGTSVAWADYVKTQLFAVILYLRLSFWPHPQIFDYGTFLMTNRTVVTVSGVIVLGLLAATVLAFRSDRPRARTAGFLGAWFFLILAPTALVPVATQTVAEHRLYLSLAAVAVLAGLVLQELFGRRKLLFAGAAVLLAASLGAATVRRNEVYRSEIALWSDTAARLPGSERAHNNLGNALYLEGHVPEALTQYELALALQPTGNPEVQYNLGNCFMAEGQLPAAAAHFREAIRLAPENADAHNNLGNALARSGRYAEAGSEYQTALRLDPTKVEAHNNLGNIWALLGHRTQAAAEYREALRLNPDYADARASLEHLMADRPGP